MVAAVADLLASGQVRVKDNGRFLAPAFAKQPDGRSHSFAKGCNPVVSAVLSGLLLAQMRKDSARYG